MPVPTVERSAPAAEPRIALVTYSVKPRGGVVHTLELAEALAATGADVTVVAMGRPDQGFYRTVDVPVEIIAAPEWAPTLDARVFSWIDALAQGLTALADRFDIVHTQDCISARAACRVRDERHREGHIPFHVVRTVHHVDAFTTPALINCQIAAILEPDTVLVVSERWRRRLAEQHPVEPHLVPNGVRSERFAVPITTERRTELRRSIGAQDRFVFLTIGGIEPRKGSEHLVAALSRLTTEADIDRASSPRRPMLAVIGGHSFQDYEEYRTRVIGSFEELGLVPDVDIVLLGTLADAEVVEWLHAADAFAFPSIEEGWGLVVLEAMSAGLPVVASDIEVFHEFLTHEVDALLTEAANPDSLAAGMRRLMDEPDTRARLVHNGLDLVTRYSWATTADRHRDLYRAISASLHDR